MRQGGTQTRDSNTLTSDLSKLGEASPGGDAVLHASSGRPVPPSAFFGGTLSFTDRVERSVRSVMYRNTTIIDTMAYLSPGSGRRPKKETHLELVKLLTHLADHEAAAKGHSRKPSAAYMFDLTCVSNTPVVKLCGSASPNSKGSEDCSVVTCKHAVVMFKLNIWRPLKLRLQLPPGFQAIKTTLEVAQITFKPGC